MVAINPIKPFDPINLSRSLCSTPDRYLTIAVFVIPNLNISMKAPDEIYKTHCPKRSTGKVRASKAKPAKPKNALVIFPAKERKFASLVNFRNAAFNF